MPATLDTSRTWRRVLTYSRQMSHRTLCKRWGIQPPICKPESPLVEQACMTNTDTPFSLRINPWWDAAHHMQNSSQDVILNSVSYPWTIFYPVLCATSMVWVIKKSLFFFGYVWRGKECNSGVQSYEGTETWRFIVDTGLRNGKGSWVRIWLSRDIEKPRGAQDERNMPADLSAANPSTLTLGLSCQPLAQQPFPGDMICFSMET